MFGLGIAALVRPWIDTHDKVAAVAALAAGTALVFSSACLIYGLARGWPLSETWAKWAQLIATVGFALIAALYVTHKQGGDMAFFGAIGDLLMAATAVPPAAASFVGFLYLQLKKRPAL